jgi:hypothetical protein
MAIFEIVPGDSCHPLDHTPAPDYVPAFWDGPHVGKRLIGALRTLRRLPTANGPRVFGNSWLAWTRLPRGCGATVLRCSDGNRAAAKAGARLTWRLRFDGGRGET